MIVGRQKEVKTMGQSNAFERMMKTAREWLAGKAPEEIAANSGVSFDAVRSVFSLVSLGKKIEVTYPDYRFSPGVEEWHQMTILHYFNLADGTPVTGEWISMSQMNSGMIRGGGFDKKFEALVRSKIGNLTAETVEAACRRLGMTVVESNADLCVRFDLAPLFPITMKLWFADPEDDLPGSGRIFLDRSADHFLTIEDAVTLCEYMILEQLQRELGI